MSYLVLARKYRPETFAHLVGQEHVVRTLSNAIALDRVHHAFLFTGSRGVGKTTTARILAKALNCAEGPTSAPCGKCTACVEIAQGVSSDVLEIDGASNTGVDNVRELRENVKYLPSKGRYKLYIIDEVHMLSQAAFNALLKTLEEPPSHVKFIFATTEPHKIPITILSRCQRFDFRRVSVQQLSEHLKTVLDKESVTLSQQAISAVVREAQGSVRDAMSLLDQVLSFAGESPADDAVLEALGAVDRQIIFDLCDAILSRDATRLLELVADVDGRGHDLGEVAELLVEHWRDLMVVRVVEEPSSALVERSPGELAALQQQASGLSRPQLHRLFRLIMEVAEDVGRSDLPRVSFEMGLLRLLEVEPAESLSSLLKKLDDLLAGAPIGVAKAAPSGGTPPSAASTSEIAEPQPSTSPREAVNVAPEQQEEPAAELPPSGEDTAWDRLVARVRAKRPAMASVLEHGKPLQFGPDGIQVGYAAGSFYMEQARDPEMRALLNDVLQEQFGQNVPFAVVTLQPGDEPSAEPLPESIAEEKARREREHEEKVKKEALEHPAVTGAVRILGGEVKDVRPLS